VGVVRYDESVYVPHSGANRSAPEGATLGEADIVGCDLDGPAVEVVDLSRVKGVDPTVAVIVRRSEWRGVYVADGLPVSEWPEVLRRRR